MNGERVCETDHTSTLVFVKNYTEIESNNLRVARRK